MAVLLLEGEVAAHARRGHGAWAWMERGGAAAQELGGPAQALVGLRQGAESHRYRAEGEVTDEAEERRGGDGRQDGRGENYAHGIIMEAYSYSC